MKRLLLTCLLALSPLLLGAQEIRTNYRLDGITHISTDYESLDLAKVPSQIRVELAGFPDGSTLYLLYIVLEQKEAVNVPKGVKMGVTLSGGKVLRLDQIGQDSATKRRQDNGQFLNRLKYAVEPADMEKMVRGIKSLDIITGWNPDDYVQASFGNDQLGSLLKRHCEAILRAADNTLTLEASLAGYTENANSILSSANPLVGRGQNYDYNILLSHLYYKNTNKEDIDLAFVLGVKEQFHIPYDAPVRLTLRDGSAIELLNTRDDVNFVYVYPSMEELFRIANIGLESLSVTYDGGTLTDSFPLSGQKNGFSDAVAQELQLLLSLSPR
ncbi:MAG: hypothetical protein J6M31_07325 [Bacteroidales bacterium]|nr:hypothetical protein [Bacteroidales bacterium]